MQLLLLNSKLSTPAVNFCSLESWFTLQQNLFSDYYETYVTKVAELSNFNQPSIMFVRLLTTNDGKEFKTSEGYTF